MKAEIHAVDSEKPDSDGNTFKVENTLLRISIKKFDDLFQVNYLELHAQKKDGTTISTLTAQLVADDLKKICDAAREAGLVKIPDYTRVLELLEEIKAEILAHKNEK